MPQSDYPRTYKAQRLLEKEAKRNREELLDSGHTLPMACGFTYVTRKPRNATPKWRPTDVICVRTAGAMTDHYGKGFCDYHEVQANAEMDDATAPKQLQHARAHAVEQAGFFGKPININPYEAITQEISRTAAVVQWLEEQMQKERERGVSDKDIMREYSIKHGFQKGIWIELFQSERKHLVDTCVAAIKAGIAERKVQIAEQQGRLIAAMMMAFIHDPELGLTPDQILRAPLLVRRHLLQLPNENEGTNIDPKKILEAHGREVLP